MSDRDIEIEADDRTRMRPQRFTRRDRFLPPSEIDEKPKGPEPGSAAPTWAGTTANSDEVTMKIGALAAPLETDVSEATPRRRRIAVREVLAWLEGFDGASWQERWESSAIEQDPSWAETIMGVRNAAVGRNWDRGYAAQGMCWLVAADAVRPSYEWMHRHHEILRTLPIVLKARDPQGLELIESVIERSAPSDLLRTRYQASARFQLSRIFGHTGKQQLGDVTVEDLARARESADGQRARTPSGAAYNAMAAAGYLPPDAPERFLDTLRTGQLSVEQLVDRTGIRSRRIRDLFVDYFRARSTGMDYNSLSGLVGILVLNFWVEIEGLQPGIESLALTPELIERWKERIRIVRHGTNAGKTRVDHGGLLVAVRGFYFDVNDWAQADPERYASFAAPNPIGPGDTKSFSKEKSRQRAASHQRTRERQPHLETVMRAVRSAHRWHVDVLAAARGRRPGDVFTVDNVECSIAVSGEASFGAVHGGIKQMGGLTLRRHDTGKFFDAVQQETVMFWRWATFSVLKETGVRIEEMEELTHTSISQYKMPSTGEVLPLLQIAPSKTDKERVLLISPELADVLAAIIHRVRGSSSSGRIPLIRRWDYQEKLLSEPMPFLFQRPIDGQNRAINRAWVLRQLRATIDEIGLVDEAGEPIYFQNHDMRRIFATEAVMAGLPVHIVANIIGHDSLDTTQQYVAIYDEDVYRRHRAFIERRRTIRPSIEYREPTGEEFQEFLGHFERRQLELGVCGRAYGTPCIHEHACIRCSMLQPDPAQAGRLREIIDNLHARVAEATAHGWFGEIEGLGVSIAGARQKLARMETSPTGPVSLGLPTLRAPDTP